MEPANSSPDPQTASDSPSTKRDSLSNATVIGFVLYAVPLFAFLMLRKVPAGPQDQLITWLTGDSWFGVALLAVPGAIIAAVCLVQDIGEERLQKAWMFLRRLGPAAVLGIGALVLPPLGSILLFWHINEVGSWLNSHGSLGVALYITGFALFAGVALLPTYSSAILGGWAFGFTVGLPAALAGFLGGSLIGYAVARPTSAERVNKLIDEKPQWKAVRDSLMRGSKARALLIVTLLRLPPNSPFALTNLVLASVRTPLWIYLLGTLIGMTPRTALVLYIASQVQGKMAEDAAKDKPWWMIAVGIGATVVVLGIVGMMAKKALAKVTAVQSPPPPPPPAT